jgi:hypothetical protein
MANKPQIKIVNVETGDEIEREMTDAEFAQYQADQEMAQEKLAEAEAKAAQRQALLDRLGITEEEAQLLLGGK